MGQFDLKIRNNVRPTMLSFDVLPTDDTTIANKQYVDNYLTNYVRTDLTNFNKPHTTLFSANPPSNPLPGDLWLSTSNGRLYVYYQDNDSSQWIQPAQNTLSVNASGVSNGIANSLSYYSETGATLTSTGANLTWNEFTNAFTVVGSITATSLHGTLTGNVTGNLFGNVVGNVVGNAETVSNGLYSTGTYSNPSWLTSLDGSKITGAVLTSGSYSNPSWITSLDGSKITSAVLTTTSYYDPSWLTALSGSKVVGNINGNAGTVTNGVYTTGTYADPTWITSLAGTKISGNIAGTASNVSGVVTTVHGGTGLSSYSTGDIVYASNSTTLAALSKGTTGYVLTAGASTPQYVAQNTLSVGSATTATTSTNIAGGSTGSILFQASAGTTSSLTLGTQGYVLIAGASAPQYSGTVTVGLLPRITTLASGYTITPNISTTDMVAMNNTGVPGTIVIAAPTGTPVDGQRLTFRIQSTNVQTFSWNSVYLGSVDLSLPAATSGSAYTDYIGFMYSASVSKWHLMGKNYGF